MATMLNGRMVTMSGSARAKWATVRVETENATYVGRMFVPETKKRLSDVLCDDRPFLNLTEVSINDSESLEGFIAVNKLFVKTVRVLFEEPENAPKRVR